MTLNNLQDIRITLFSDYTTLREYKLIDKFELLIQTSCGPEFRNVKTRLYIHCQGAYTGRLRTAAFLTLRQRLQDNGISILKDIEYERSHDLFAVDVSTIELQKTLLFSYLGARYVVLSGEHYEKSTL